MKLDPKIDALFRLPLDEFTEKRNALVKELSGEPKKQIKFLTKPPLPIWAVNQLYWQERPTYSALVDASEKLRTAHRAALSGHKADIRKAEQVHRAALEKAVANAIALLERSQGQVSDAARETVRKALAALPADESPGRTTRVPEAAGFSLLEGITGARGARGATGARSARRALAAAKEAASKARAEEAARLQEKAIAAAERDLQRARKAAEQAKFQVRTRQTALENAQAAGERSAAEVALAQRKLDELRRR